MSILPGLGNAGRAGPSTEAALPIQSTPLGLSAVRHTVRDNVTQFIPSRQNVDVVRRTMQSRDVVRGRVTQMMQTSDDHLHSLFSFFGLNNGEQNTEADEWLVQTTTTGEVGKRIPTKRTAHSYLIDDFSEAELRWVILPFGTFRGIWDVVTLLLVLYTSVVLPYTLCIMPAD